MIIGAKQAKALTEASKLYVKSPVIAEVMSNIVESAISGEHKYLTSRTLGDFEVKTLKEYGFSVDFNDLTLYWTISWR